MSTRNKHCKNRGFSLLELMLALALMGALIGSLTASLTVAYKARARVDNALGALVTLQTTFDDIQMELESALPPGEVFADVMYCDTDDDAPVTDTPYLEWYTNHPIELPEDTVVKGDIRKVELALTTRDGYEYPVLVKRTTTNLLATQVVEPTEQVLCRNVQSLSIQFYDGTDWYDTWDGSTTEEPLPILIEITIQLQSDNPDDDQAQAEAPKMSRLYRIISTTAQSDGSDIGGGSGQSAGGGR
jgi:prepilin-type N-terminal cleavage/methylation domain-containing protein